MWKKIRYNWRYQRSFFMGIFRALIKFYILLGMVFSYGIFMSPLLVILPLCPIGTRRLTAHVARVYCRLAIKVIGVHPGISGKNRHRIHRCAHLIISNHLSYLDVFLISSLFPVNFVTSKELQRTPLLGQVADLAGCIYVERRKVFQLPKEIRSLERALGGGLHIVVFPEARSSNGEKVLPFKRSLMKSAVSTGSPILPLCINYRSINGEAVTKRNRDRVFWYGKMPFFPHFWRLLRARKIRVDLDVLEVADTADVQLNRVADTIFRLVSDRYDPV